MTRPGASEVYAVLVPCAMTPGGKHEVRIRLRLVDNRITFENTCHPRVADAHDRLASVSPSSSVPETFSCLSWVERMRRAIRNRTTSETDLVRCHTCDSYVPEWRSHCALRPRNGFEHRINRSALPFWNRLVRSGRVR